MRHFDGGNPQTPNVHLWVGLQRGCHEWFLENDHGMCTRPSSSRPGLHGHEIAALQHDYQLDMEGSRWVWQKEEE